MATRSAAFAGKISHLRENILRIQNGSIPQPTCLDLANMMKYFSQVLHDFRNFKDIENVPLYAHEKKDRLDLIESLPNFDYCGLYKALSNFVDILALIPQSSVGLDQLGGNLLMLFKCLVPFLDQPHMESVPYLVSTLFMSLPESLHKEILDTLCYNLLPFTLQQHQHQDQQRHNVRTSRRKRPKEGGLGAPKSFNFQDIESSSVAPAKPHHCIVRIESSCEDEPPRAVSSSSGAFHRLRSNSSRSRQEIQSQTQSLNENVAGVRPEFNDNVNVGDDDDEEEEEEEEEEDIDEFALLSVTSILMIVFHYCPEPMHHSQLVECLMKLKTNVFEDLLFVIAYGTTKARCPAVEILFRYWPEIRPAQERKNNNNQLEHFSWLPNKCQNKNCNPTSLTRDDEAVKMCLDFKISITMSGSPPPMLICMDCVDSIYKMQLASSYLDGPPTDATTAGGGADHLKIPAIDNYSNKFMDILLPMERVSKTCENKKCKSENKKAVGTCFDIECANYNCKRPIRYCKSCFKSIHEPCKQNNFDATLQNHIRHSSIELNITKNQNSTNTLVEAIISLLKEAAPLEPPSKETERLLTTLDTSMQFNNDKTSATVTEEKASIMSQYGIWLMAGFCKPIDTINDELLGRLLGMLFQWFRYTAQLTNCESLVGLENFKGDYIKAWLMEVKEKRREIFISCLLPHPIDCSKIGGHWETWPDTAYQIKEGYKRMWCLISYDIVTDDVWEVIMPSWMECFRHEVPESELNELKMQLSEMFQESLSFQTNQMYNFITRRLEDENNTNQEQVLCWLQIITMLEIAIPTEFLFSMLRSSVRSLNSQRMKEIAMMKQTAAAASATETGGHQSRAGAKKISGSRSTNQFSTNSECSTEQLSGAEEFDQSSRPEDDDEDDGGGGGDEDGSYIDGQGSDVDETEDGGGVEDGDYDDDVLVEMEDPRLRIAQSQQERKAQARAAFTARVLQHASMLDGGSSKNLNPQLVTPTLKNLSSNPVSTTSLGGGGGAGGGGAGIGHRQPLKSVSQPFQGGKKERGGGIDNKKKRMQQKSVSQTTSTSLDDVLGETRIDNNLVCFILMLDILLKQFDLQETGSHLGLESREAQQTIELLNEIFASPWLGNHTCSNILMAQQQQQSDSTGGVNLSAPTQKDAADRKRAQESISSSVIHGFSHCAQGFEQESLYETCVFCEIISTFHQLSMFLMEFFVPVIEVSIYDVSDEGANEEFDGRPDYSRVGCDHLGPSPPAKQADPQQFTFEKQHQTTGQQQEEPFSPSYLVPSLKPEVLKSLSKELQLTYHLLIQFHQYQTPDIVSQLLQMIKLLSLHSQVLSKAVKGNPPFIAWCQHNMLVGRLWSLCQLESSELARNCVPLLMYCITLPWGVRLFRDLVERDFNNDNWLVRFRAVERVVTIAYFCEPSTIKNSKLLQSVIARAFCYVVRCLDDIEAIVAQRALVSLEMMKTSSLKLLLWCLEVQFDHIIADRPMILRSVFQLYNHLRDRRFLSWEFFLNRFDTIFFEAQIYLQQNGEIPLTFAPQDLKNTNTKSASHEKKRKRAEEALKGSYQSRSLSNQIKEQKFSFTLADSNVGEPDEQTYRQSVRLQEQMEQSYQQQQQQHLMATKSADDRRARSPMRRVMKHGRTTSSRYQSVALLTSQFILKPPKNSKSIHGNLALQNMPLPPDKGQHLPSSLADDASNLARIILEENHAFGVVHRIYDQDRDTNHSLIFLLMQFFSKPDPSHPQPNEPLNKNHRIVLRHLNILMGYSDARKNFIISATQLRLLPVFNAFLTSLPKVLDFNYPLGTILLDTFLPILIYCPAPDELHYDSIKRPEYSLWLLNPLMRHSWLMSVMAFLYKYQFGDERLKDHVYKLVSIVINTLELHLNRDKLEESTQLISGGRGEQTNGCQTGSVQELVAETSKSGSVAKAEDSLLTSNARSLLESPIIKLGGALKSSSKIQQSTVDVAPSATAEVVVAKRVQETSPKTLIKADTSDCLQLSSKAQHKLLTKSGGSIKMQELRSTGELAGCSDERLLPIGKSVVVSSSKLNRNTGGDLPSCERLLPIGVQVVNQNKVVLDAASNNNNNIHENTSLSSKPRELVLQVGPGSPGALSQTVGTSENLTLKHGVRVQQAHLEAVSSPVNQDPPQSASSVTKGNRRRFGGMGKHHGLLADTGSKSSPYKEDFDFVSDLQEKISVSGAGKKGKGFSNKSRAEATSKQLQSAMLANFLSPPLLNEQLAQINRHSLVQEFSDKDLSMCLVILETFIHHEPSMAARMLPTILRLVARYSSASPDSSQSGNNAHLVGGSMFVARQFIRVALHDLIDNNIFQQIFTSSFTGTEFYKSMATSLADFPDLNQLTPLSRLFEDLNKQKNLPQAPTLQILLKNVATYIESVISESSSLSQATWTSFITNWDNFLRKLILALPRYSGLAGAPGARADHIISGSGGGGGGGSHQSTSFGASGQSSAANQLLIAPQLGANANANPLSLEPADSSSGSTSGGATLSSSCSQIMEPIMRIILATTKISHLASCKTIVDPYSKIISYIVLNSQFKYELLLEINHNCCRLYTRDREKYLIQRTIAYELVQVLKFRFSIIEENLLILLLFILQDVNGTLPAKLIRDTLKIEQSTLNQADSFVTNVNECLRQYIGDLLEFIMDVHAVNRINENLVGQNHRSNSSNNRDTFGGHVKAAVSQYLALEISLASGTDSRTVARYLPWLYPNHAPPPPQSPREFLECVSHIRQLSWIILGSLQHSILTRGGATGTSDSCAISSSLPGTTGAPGSSGTNAGNQPATSGAAATTNQQQQQQQQQQQFLLHQQQQQQHQQLLTGTGTASNEHQSSSYTSSHLPNCQPIPIEKNGNIAGHVQNILTGFAEQSKESVLHMSGLFHAFLLCQLWTMYCENICAQHSVGSEQYQSSQSTLDDFWALITPGVLQLVGHSPVMSEMVSTHFLQLIESLIESNSSILFRYLPMWNSVFYSYKRRNKSGNLALRLQKCIEWQPPDLKEQDSDQSNKRLANWLEKVQYKMSHIEIQSSQAAPFYLT